MKPLRSRLTRYAFGDSDQKPSVLWWGFLALMIFFIICNLVSTQ